MLDLLVDREGAHRRAAGTALIGPIAMRQDARISQQGNRGAVGEREADRPSRLGDIGTGTDHVTAGIGGNETVVAGDGTNTISAGGANDSITTGNGKNTIAATGASATIVAGNGGEMIAATGPNDQITTGSGNDTIQVTAGAATIKAGLGTNTIRFAGSGRVSGAKVFRWS